DGSAPSATAGRATPAQGHWCSSAWSGSPRREHVRGHNTGLWPHLELKLDGRPPRFCPAPFALAPEPRRKQCRLRLVSLRGRAAQEVSRHPTAPAGAHGSILLKEPSGEISWETPWEHRGHTLGPSGFAVDLGWVDGARTVSSR